MANRILKLDELIQAHHATRFVLEDSGRFAGTLGVDNTLYPTPYVDGSLPIYLYDFGDSWADLGASVTGKWSNSFSWVRQLNAIAGAPFRIRNAGVSGNTTTMMLARFAADVIAQGQGWVVIPAGTVNDPANGILPSTAIANVTAMCVAAKAAGFRVILAGCPTNGNVTSTAYPERRRYHGALNAWARSYAVANGHLFADISRYSTDPGAGATVGGNFFSGYSFDSTHLSPMGALRIAQGVYADIGAFLPKVPAFSSQSDPYNLIGPAGLANGNNASGTGGFVANTGCTGTGPNGWAVRRGPGSAANSVVTSTVTRLGGGTGSAGRLVYTASTDDYNDGRWMIGADGLSATAGRWNIAWGPGQTITWNLRRAPTTPNGYNYVPVAIAGGVSGTTGGSEPLWPAEEGGMVVDNQITWMAIRIPLAGELLYAEVEGATSGLTGNAGIELRLVYTDTSSTTISTYDLFHTNDSTRGQYEDVAHGNFVMRTREPLVVPAVGPLQIYVEVKATGRANSALTLDVGRVKIGNLTRESLLG